MKSLSVVLLTLQALCHCTEGFSLVATKSPSSSRRTTVLCATQTKNEENISKGVNVVGATIAVAMALGWSVASSPSQAAPLNNDWTSTASMMRSSSFVVALSESDFADFSLPSYQDVTSAEINTNLKGGKMLFGEDVAAASR